MALLAYVLYLKEKQGPHGFLPQIIGLQKLASLIPVLASWAVSPLTCCLVTAEKTNIKNCTYILVLLNTLLGIFGHPVQNFESVFTASLN